MQPSDVAIPILPSRAIGDTVDVYRQLGFTGGAHAHDPSYAILTRASLELHFFAHRDLVPAESSAGCYLRVQDVEGIYDAFSNAKLPRTGIPRMEALEDKPWGMKEFALVDLDDTLLRIGQVMAT